jgi:hypothetical protein
LLLAMALIAGGCGGGDDGTGSGSATTGSGATTGKAEGHAPVDRGKVASALNQLVAECIRRRRAGAGAGDVSRRFGAAVKTLVAEYRGAPRRPFVPKPGVAPTTMQEILDRVRNTLGRPIPDGCAARTPGPRQRAAIRQLDRALSTGP